MKKYIAVRLLRSLISVFLVVACVVAIVFKLVPTTRAFQKDATYKKIKGNTKIVYEYSKLEDLGYLDYVSMADMCAEKSDDVKGCLIGGSDEQKEVIEAYEKSGYSIKELTEYDDLQGGKFAYRYYSVPELVVRFFKRLFVFDGPNKVPEDRWPEGVERGISVEKGPNGIPALACSGCVHKYLLYVDGKFPFLHQNFLNLEFGESFPTHAGLQTTEVIMRGQGSMKKKEQLFETGQTINSPVLQYTREFKDKPDSLDKKRYNDNYAKTQNQMDAPSMVSVSYIFGVLSVILAYLLALPAGVIMARNKGKFADKLGIVYINLLISVPSLAFIFFMKFIGNKLGFPDTFPQLGFHNIKSYVMPTIILALMSTPSIMMWVRRFMVDQSTADYVKFAKAKGLSKSEISKNHIFKNAVIPIVNGIPSSIILAISGAVITETIFATPGMGKMLPDAISVVNNNMVITLTFIFTALSIFSVLLGDVLMTVVDPRIQLSAKKGE